MRKMFFMLLIAAIASNANSQTTYFSKAAATDFNDVNSWGTGTDGTGAAPASISNADNFVVANGSVMTLSAPATVRSLYIGSVTGFVPATAAGTLTLTTGNTLTVSRATGNNATLGLGTSGTLTINDGLITLNGNFAMTGGTFNQSGGSMVVDGNDNNTAASSVPSGTHLVSFAGSAINCTAGSITIVDPPVNSYAVQTTRALVVTMAASNTYFSGTHTFIFGDGVSTTPGNTDGFTVETFSSGRAPIQNLTVDAGAGTGRYGSTSFNSSTAWGTHIKGTLTITAGSEFRVNPNSTSANEWLVGSIVNNGTLTASRTTSPPILNIGGHASLTGYTPAVASSITGSGVFRNLATSPTASFGSMVINNAQGLSFGAGTLALGTYTGNFSGTLTMTTGAVNTNGQTLLLGIGTGTLGTLTYTAGGFTSGSSFGRWYAAATAGTTITAGAVPAFGTGSYPFIAGANARNFHINRPATTGATGGVIAVQFNDGVGLNTIGAVVDGAYSIDRQTAANWVVSTSAGFAAGTGTFAYAAAGQGLYNITNSNSRIMKSASVVGTHQAGTTLPLGQRAAIAAADFTGTFYLGISSTEIPIVSAQSGPWEDPATWVGGVVPVCGNNTIIANTHTVVVNAAAANTGNLLINAGGVLTVSGNVLTIGCTNNNNTLTNSGTLNISAGTINMNGNLVNASGSTFNQTGGTINVDGNAAGVTANSVATGTALVSFASNLITATGGSLIIVDPHAGTGTETAITYTGSGNVNLGTGHTLQFGDGVSTTAGGSATGFRILPGSKIAFGNVVVNTLASANAVIQHSSQYGILGDLTVTAGDFQVLSGGTAVYVNGNIVNNGTITTTGNLAFANFTNAAQTASANAQTIGGSGVFRNATSSPTANFATLTINNSNAAGVTFSNANSLLSGANTGTVSGTLTMTTGFINTGANALILGINATTNGTLSYTAGGFASGSTFSRWWPTTTGGATITAGTTPAGTSAGVYPFAIGTPGSFVYRSMYMNQTAAATTGGKIAVTYADAAGTSPAAIVDGAYTVDVRSNASWAVATTGITGTPVYTMAINAQGLYSAANGNSRITLAAAPAGGSHQNGTTYVNAQRLAVPFAGLANTFYVGINNVDIPFISVATGNWEDGTTWNKNPATPTAADAVIIASGTTVTVNAVAAAALNTTVNAGGTLTVSGNTLAITNTLANSGTFNATGGTTTITAAATTGVTNAATTGVFNVNGGTVNVGVTDNTACNRTFSNSGTLTVSSGVLNIFGNLVSNAGGLFNQSGGAINVDGNAGGNAANSVASSTAIVQLNPTALTDINLTGGTLTIVDPHANTTLSSSFSMSTSATGTVSATTGHTVRFGNGVSADAGGNAGGFNYNPWVTTGGMRWGNIVMNGPAGTNRNFVQPTTFGALFCLGDLTINSGATLSQTGTAASSTIAVGGNLNVNSGGTIISLGAFALGNATFTSGTGMSVGATSQAQTITNSGTIQNLAASPTANLTNLQVNNTNATGVTLASPISVSGTLTMTAGLINTTATNLLSLGTATAAGTLTGTGSSTNMIIGPFARTFAASRTASGTYSNTTLFPVGKGASYLPIHIDPSTSAGGSVVMRGEVFTSNAGTLGAGVTSLASNRWEALATTGLANLTNSFIRLNDGGITGTNKILQSTSAAGVYDNISVASTFAAGTPNTLTTATSIAAASYSGYFSYGDVTVCATPADQPTGFTVSALGSTSFNGSFTAAVSAPSNYLVVRYLSPATETPPVDFTSYTVGGALGAGTIVSTSSATSFSQTGLTAGTTYTYYIYSFNNGLCSGPVYRTAGPLIGNVTTCASATGTPGTPTSSAITSTSFTATWAASSTPGVTYELDVATNNTFTTFVPGYNALNVGGVLTYNVNTGLSASTTYYVRVRAVITACYSSNSGTLTVTTDCAPFTPVYTQDFASYVPTCWKEQTGFLNPTPTALTGTSSSWTSDGWLNSGSTGAAKINLFSTGKKEWLVSPGIDLGVSGNYQLEFDLATLTFGAGTGSVLGSDDSLAVVISTDNGLTWGNANILGLWTASNTPVSASGLHVTIPLSSYTGTVRIGFYGSEGTVDDAEDVDVMIDNFAINLIPACPVPTAVSVGSITATTASVSFTSAGSNFIVEYGPVGFTPGTGATAGAGGTVVTGTASPIAITGLTAGATYHVYVRQVCAGPVYSTNSTPVVSFTTPLIVSSFPYCEGFETGGLGWSSAIFSGSANDWVIGTPAKTQIAGAHAGTNAYVTKTTGTYSSSQNAYVKSPVFDFSALTIDPKISFWSNFKTETGWDAGILEVSTDGGTTWNKVDATLGTGATFNTATSTNWYNSSSTSGPIAPPKWSSTSTAYTGHASGWINSVAQLPGFKGAGYANVQFRWRFGSDGSGVDEGWAIDDICVTAVDDVPPAITYAPVTNTVCGTDITLSPVAITDGLGVDVNPGTKPRLYFKKSTDANTYAGNTNADNGWKYVEASNGATPFSFTTNYALLQAPVVVGDIIQYFVVAQDIAGTPNVGINSGTFAAAPTSVALTAGAFPLGGTIRQYTVSTPVGGSITIGAAGTYPSLTGAGGLFSAINSGGITSDITVTIIDPSVTETGANALNAVSYGCSGGPYTITIKPGSGVSTTLTGSLASGALIKLNGASNVVIDGSNNGTNSRDMTITNTATTSPTTVAISSVGTTPVTNNTLKNTNVINGVNTSSAVVVSDGGTIGSAGYFNNITIRNNNIQKAYIGVYAIAVAGGGNGSGYVLDSNQLNSTGTDAIEYIGLYLQGVDGATVKNNTVGNFDDVGDTDDKGIWLATATINTNVFGNKISNLSHSAGNGYGGHGIYLSSGNATANLAVYNNFISGLTGDGWSYTSTSATDNPIGIVVTGTQGGVRLYNNSINLDGNTLDQSNAMSMGIYLGTGSSADIRNNIIVNNLGLLGATGYGSTAIYAASSNTQFTNINYNDYVVNPTGTGGKYIGQINTSGATTLATWQTASGQDANSISVAPVFVSATDLHLVTNANCGLHRRGTPLPGVTVDIDNETRSATAPDMGADEYANSTAGTQLWTGAQSTDWFDVRNWNSCEIPGTTSDVVINGSLPNYPVVNANVTIKSIAVNPAASLTIATGVIFTLLGP